MEHTFAIVLFAISTMATPGPNTLMIMSSGVNFGVKRSLPHFFGICLGFTLMLFLVGLGFSKLFELYPEFYTLKWLGTMYLLYLAYLISKSSKSSDEEKEKKPFSFVKAVLIQWLNAKAWAISAGAVAAYITVGEHVYRQI